MRYALLLLSLLTISSPASAGTAEAPPVDPAAQRAQCARDHLQAFMKARRVPGLSIAVGQAGKVTWAEAFGVADLAAGTPVTTDSTFPIGSTTKTLTSLALGKLVEEGKIDLDAPIQTYVPYFPVKGQAEEAAKAGEVGKTWTITPRLLAGHLAGLRDYDMATEYYNTKVFPTVRDSVGVFKDDPLIHEPGTKYAYSAYGFVLLSAAIEGASGQDYLSFMKSRITAPLGLTHTGPDLRPAEMPGLVTSYVGGFMGVPTPAQPGSVSNKWGAGGFVSTPTEMVHLGNAVLKGEVVKPETFALLTTPQTLKNGEGTGAGYAMGWRSGKAKMPASGRELRVVHHGGTANGAMSFFVLFPEDGLVVSINSNLLIQPFTDFSGEAYFVADLFLQAEPGCPKPDGP